MVSGACAQLFTTTNSVASNRSAIRMPRNRIVRDAILYCSHEISSTELPEFHVKSKHNKFEFQCGPQTTSTQPTCAHALHSPTFTRNPSLCDENSGAYMHIAVVTPLLKSPAWVTRRSYSKVYVPGAMRSKKKCMATSLMLW